MANGNQYNDNITNISNAVSRTALGLLDILDRRQARELERQKMRIFSYQAQTERLDATTRQGRLTLDKLINDRLYETTVESNRIADYNALTQRQLVGVRETEAQTALEQTRAQNYRTLNEGVISTVAQAQQDYDRNQVLIAEANANLESLETKLFSMVYPPPEMVAEGQSMAVKKGPFAVTAQGTLDYKPELAVGAAYEKDTIFARVYDSNPALDKTFRDFSRFMNKASIEIPQLYKRANNGKLTANDIKEFSGTYVGKGGSKYHVNMALLNLRDGLSDEDAQNVIRAYLHARAGKKNPGLHDMIETQDMGEWTSVLTELGNQRVRHAGLTTDQIDKLAKLEAANEVQKSIAYGNIDFENRTQGFELYNRTYAMTRQGLNRDLFSTIPADQAWLFTESDPTTVDDAKSVYGIDPGIDAIGATRPQLIEKEKRPELTMPMEERGTISRFLGRARDLAEQERGKFGERNWWSQFWRMSGYALKPELLPEVGLAAARPLIKALEQASLSRDIKAKQKGGKAEKGESGVTSIGRFPALSSSPERATTAMDMVSSTLREYEELEAAGEINVKNRKEVSTADGVPFQAIDILYRRTDPRAVVQPKDAVTVPVVNTRMETAYGQSVTFSDVDLEFMREWGITSPQVIINDKGWAYTSGWEGLKEESYSDGGSWAIGVGRNYKHRNNPLQSGEYMLLKATGKNVNYDPKEQKITGKVRKSSAIVVSYLAYRAGKRELHANFGPLDNYSDNVKMVLYDLMMNIGGPSVRRYLGDAIRSGDPREIARVLGNNQLCPPIKNIDQHRRKTHIGILNMAKTFGF